MRISTIVAVGQVLEDTKIKGMLLYSNYYGPGTKHFTRKM